MCGLAGYSGIASSLDRQRLVWELGYGIDDRGGDAAGFVTVSHTLRYCKRKGMWSSAKNRFLKAAATGNVTMMHSRWATCGVNDISEVHPFVIKRNGNTVLYGAHNGIIYDAWDSAKKNGREIEVDSQEIFELLADGKVDEIAELCGYGVITWIYADNPTVVNIARMSKNSEIEVAKLKGGGMVWASTSKILREAVKNSQLEIETEYDLKDIGTVYQIENGEIGMTDLPKVKLSEGGSIFGGYSWQSGSLFGSSKLASAFARENGQDTFSTSTGRYGSPHSDYGSIDSSIEAEDVTYTWDAYLRSKYSIDEFDNLSEDDKDVLYELHAEELIELDDSDEIIGDEDDYHLIYAKEDESTDDDNTDDKDVISMEDLDASWDRWMRDEDKEDWENEKNPFYYRG